MTKKIENVLPVFILLFALLVLGSMFFDVLKYSNGEPIMTGVVATFGGTPYSVGTFFNHTIQFSFLNATGFLLPAIMSIIFVVSVINSKKTSLIKMVFGVLLTLSFILSVVLLFQLPVNTIHTTTLGGFTVRGNFSGEDLAIGAILGYVFAIIGSIISLIYTVLQFEK